MSITIIQLIIISISICVIILLLTLSLVFSKKIKEKFGNEELIKFNGEGELTDKHYLDNFYFIHNFKVMGTTIHSQLPKEYNNRFYGKLTNIKEYEKKNNIKLNLNEIIKFNNSDFNATLKKGILPGDPSGHQAKSIDHMLIDDLFNLGILKEEDKSREFIMIVRDPIDRFISMCNYLKKYNPAIKPKTLIDWLKFCAKKTKINSNIFAKYPEHTQNPINFWACHLQSDLIKNKNNLNINLFKLENKEGIKNFFKKFNINLDLNLVVHKSVKKFTIHDLTNEQKIFLKNFYARDYELYNKAK